MKLINRLRLLRQEKNSLSQHELADIVGCSRQTIISIETGCKNPSVELALKISQALATPVDQIFFLEEGKEKEKFCQKIAAFFRRRS